MKNHIPFQLFFRWLPKFHSFVSVNVQPVFNLVFQFIDGHNNCCLDKSIKEVKKKKTMLQNTVSLCTWEQKKKKK